ncbi:NUDIX hydrolase [Petroclostridium sp. X23]|uniref:NUDIX domain-containing protein n=1 Tax=Petroclostridium sp. X23 TaxID=3045146 RepID=UPI0024ADA090|nr:NUDIX hydrolase [Petroclostridium sp. X23]WHH57118.1 NUDIX hydrolase [Petroclostridium sp. X23]
MKFRVRAAAIILNDNKELLMVHHRHPKTGEEWLTLPGGGLEGSESATEAIIREVKEECRIDCTPEKLVYVREFLDFESQVHHVELFFTAHVENFEIQKGIDPEFEEQFIINVEFLSQNKIKEVETAVFPEVLRDTFWVDLQNGFSAHTTYLGKRRWK